MLLFIFAAFLVNPACLQAQNKVRIIHADSITGGTFNGSRIQKILGNVHLKMNNFEMYADSAYKFVNKNVVKAYGNIEINTKNQMIWADSLTYFSNTNFCKFRGRVIIKSDSSTLFGRVVNYQFKSEIGHFLDGVRLKDSKGILTADRGFFYRKADSAVFRGNVQLKDSLKYLEGDSLFANRQSGYYELYGHVFGSDPVHNSKVSGDYLQSDSTGKRIVKGHARLVNYKGTSTNKKDTTKPDSLFTPKESLNLITPDSLPSFKQDSARVSHDNTTNAQPDTTVIFAHKIISIAHRTPNDTTTTVKAYKDVRVWSTDFSAISDSAKYNSKTIRSNYGRTQKPGTKTFS